MTAKIDVDQIQTAVRQRYAGMAQTAEGKCAYPTGKAGAQALVYDLSRLREVPDDVFAAFCGVGNPFSLGPVHAGEVVLDVGCGGGLDLIMAHQLVGSSGRVCGIDLTPEMVVQARLNLERVGVTNSEVRCARAEAIPYAADTFDVVVSNGVLNLSPDKEQSFREIYRVLKPEGRLQFADMVLQQDLPSDVVGDLVAWSD
jgi:arsenite methyltransferase